MQMFIKDDTGLIIATYQDGTLLSGMDLDKGKLAFDLFKLLFELMNSTGAGGFGFQNPLQGVDDIEGGTA